MSPLRFTAIAICALLGCGPLVVSSQPSPATGPEVPSLRLPEGARPLSYHLALTVVPGAAKAAGEITIDVVLSRPHPVLWLNAEALNVSSAVTDAVGVKASLLGAHDPFVGLAFDPPLPAGRHRLTLVFEAEQSRNSSRGLFTMEQDGAWYTMTQFEPTSARRAFPCFDEPAYKVPWTLSLTVPRDVVAVANTPVAAVTDLPDGMKIVRFEATRPLPSYLVAFAVGPWEFVDLGRIGMQPTPTRIVVPRGRAGETGFVAGAYPELFARIERWFGIAHPYPKLDHIAIPLNVPFAMENAGLVTYGEWVLLAKPEASSPRFRRVASGIGAHEIAHQWFGNLVTPTWWDDIWLNEAFATWFAEKMVSQWHPDWERGSRRVVERAEAMEADARASARQIREPIRASGDIKNAFDGITYQKGATVIAMFEGWIGEPAFRRAVQRYLAAHQDGNATVQDFLSALSKASGHPVDRAFSTFLDQNGMPQVAVALDCSGHGAKLTLTQQRYATLGARPATGARWQIPVCVKYGTNNGPAQACTLLSDASATMRIGGSCPSYVFANAGGRGYYLPDYRGDLLARLAANRGALTVAESASLIYDLRPLVSSGAITAAQALAWVQAGARGGQRQEVVAAIEVATFIRDIVVGPDEQASFQAFVRTVFGPRARRLGFAPSAGESDDDQLLRRALLRFAGPYDPEIAEEARRLALAWTRDRSTIDPALTEIVLVIAARTGDAALFDALLVEARTTTKLSDRRDLLVALFSFGEPALARRGQALLLDPGLDIRDLVSAHWGSLRSSPPEPYSQEFLVAHFDAYAKRVSADQPATWPFFAQGLCSADARSEVEAFWRGRTARYPGAERNVSQTLDAIEICSQVRAAQQPSARAYLAKP